MTEPKQQWRVTTWIVYTGTPGESDFKVLASGDSEKAAILAAMAKGVPIGARVGQVRER